MEFLQSVLKRAPWSVSKVDTLLLCMRSFSLRYIENKKELQKGEASRVGVVVHSILEYGLQNPTLDVEGLRDQFAAEHQLVTSELLEVNSRLPAVVDFIKRIQVFKENVGCKRELFEFKVAIKADFTKCGFFEEVELAPGIVVKGGLMRGVIDHAIITRDDVMVIIDHKTGKKMPIGKHEPQFSAYRLMALAAFPELVGVQCAINYVGDTKLVWSLRPDKSLGAWTRHEILSQLRPWCMNYLNGLGRKLHVLQEGPALPETGWKCEWCGYTHLCEEGKVMYDYRMAEKAKKKAKAGGTDDSGDVNV